MQLAELQERHDDDMAQYQKMFDTLVSTLEQSTEREKAAFQQALSSIESKAT